MDSVPRWVSAPLLRAWIASKSGEVDRLPRPGDAPESHTAGVDSDRVLIFGGGLAVGWGVLSHEIALPGALSRALSLRTGRGADVYVVAVPRLKVGSALDELDKIKLHRYDAVVVTLGVNDAGALTPLASWDRDLKSTIRTISQRARRDARIFVAGVHPIRSIPIYDSPLGSVADAHARKMNAISAHVCRQLQRVTYVPLTAAEPCSPLRFRNAASYRHWGDELADSVAPQLDAKRRWADFSPGMRIDYAREREVAVRDLGLLVDDGSRRLDNVVALARTSLGVKSATVSVIDRDHLVHKAEVGNVPQGIMLRESFTAAVIREPDGMVVPDAAIDPRFRDLPHVFGEPRIRFYAGFPLESPDGTRIGTLNVFDPAPRFSDESSRLVHLRQFGLMAQSELTRI
ncbi:MAG: diguanylate cyclase [Schumannella sp.]|nr:diguanylate cyclase [Schumannella sp.]